MLSAGVCNALCGDSHTLSVEAHMRHLGGIQVECWATCHSGGGVATSEVSDGIWGPASRACGQVLRFAQWFLDPGPFALLLPPPRSFSQADPLNAQERVRQKWALGPMSH